MAMTPKEKAAYWAEVKKRGNIQKGEVITPGSVIRGVAKVAAKVAGKSAAKTLTAAEKAMVKEVKYIAKNAKPGSVQKMMDKLPAKEKAAYSAALSKAVPAKAKAAVYKPVKQAVPTKVVKKTTEPIYKNSKTGSVLEQQYEKAVRGAKLAGLDIKKVKVTVDGKTMDYKGIR